MEINPSQIEKYRPRRRKIGEARNQREELIDKVLAKLNEEQKRDKRPLYTYARVAGMFAKVNDAGIYALNNECSGSGVRSFGAMLAYKLKRYGIK